MKDNNNETKNLKIKLRNNNKFIINLVTIILILIIGIVMVGVYPKIDAAGYINEYEDRIEGYLSTYEFDEDLSKNTFVLYKEALEIKQGNFVEASDIYIKPESEFENTNDYDVLKYKVNDYLKEWKRDFEDNFLNLDYVVLDKDNNVIKSNNNNLGALANINEDSTLKDKYSFYVSIKFDENGKFTVNNIYGRDEANIGDKLLLRKLVYTDNYDIVNPIKNMTFIYGINKNLKYSDKISAYVYRDNNRYEAVTYLYVLILSVAVIILSLCIPLKLENEVVLYKKLFKLPFEIIFILISITTSAMVLAAPNLIREAINGAFKNVILSQTLQIEQNISNQLIYLFNVLYWYIYITLIFISIVVVKNIFTTGLIKYCKEKTLISIILGVIKIIAKKTYKNTDNMIRNFNLKDKSNKFSIKLLGINILIILIASMIWICGVTYFFYRDNSMLVWTISVIIAYNLILFILIRKYLNGITNDFRILLNATSKIADGNLDAAINEDVGLFNPIKELIERIKAGFKKAVDEEVKSQKMKTELISNVSHDLKTPLTSIITYVDLLKGENVTEDDRKSYVDTLDKKSQRLKFLIEDLFEVSKASSGNITLNLVKVDIIELMKQTQIELEDKISKNELNIKNNFPSCKIVIELDSQKTFRIFENLLNNVAKYAMKGSRVYVDIIDNEKNVEITIKNMSAEEINFNAFDIVERFQRGDKSRNTEGSGLGLAIAKSFVEVQGGRFKIEIDGDLFKVIMQFRK